MKPPDPLSLLRLPLLRADCEADFRHKFGRSMTKAEETLLRLGNTVLDGPEEQLRQQSPCAHAVERAMQTCDNSRDAIGRAVLLSEEAKRIIAHSRLLLWQLRNRDGSRDFSTWIKRDKLEKTA